MKVNYVHLQSTLIYNFNYYKLEIIYASIFNLKTLTP